MGELWDSRARSILRKTSRVDGSDDEISISSGRFIQAAVCKNWALGVQRHSLSHCFLQDLVSKQKIKLPSSTIPLNQIHKFILSAPPTQPDCIVLFLLKNCPRFMFCRVGDNKWTKLDYDEDRDDGITAFEDVITFDGKLYGLDGEGTLRLIEVGSHLLQVVSIEAEFPNWSRLKKNQLVECRGHLVLVQRTSVRKTLFSLLIFVMDFVESKWMLVTNSHNWVFFLSHNYSFCLPGRDLGIRGNSVYFTENDDDLYVFRLDQKSLSVSRNQETSTLSILFNGLMPFLRVHDNLSKNEELITGEEEKDFKETKEASNLEDGWNVQGGEDNQIILSKLSLDLQRKIAKSIRTTRDYMNFRGVCRRWRSLAPPIRWRSADPMGSTSASIRYPWLMFSEGDQKDVYKFYDPIYDVTYYMNNTDLSKCQIHCSKDGWLLVSENIWSVFFYEPFTKTRIQLPKLLLGHCFHGISFSTTPTSSNWVIFGLCCIFSDFIVIFYIRSGDKNWTYEDLYFDEKEFIPSCGNPVFYDDNFYCLGQDGSLGIFKLNETDYSWYICKEPVSSRFFSNTDRAFLVASKEELFSVFLGHMGNSVHVFKWDGFEMDWVELEDNSLKNQMLFVSQTSTLVITTMEEEIMNNNTLFLPVFNNSGDNVFYSLESGRYKTLGANFFDDLYDTKEFLFATWILPLLFPSLNQ